MNSKPRLVAVDGGLDVGRLHRVFIAYVVCLFGFLAVMALAEHLGMPRPWLGAIFLLSSLALYTTIGIYCRTTDAHEYYVAGGRVPALYNGMATAADWMSAASFISLAGGLYLQGFSGTSTQPGGLAYLLGWTGGFCLLALLIVPNLRKLGLYTVPDYFGVRFGGRWPRLIAALAAVLCSFTYVVAQIYGVGLITSRLMGVRFEIGVLLGLSGVLMCSFLGGMRAVTWTQVAQYVVILMAFVVPVSWLSYQQMGNPLAPLAFGQQLEKITAMENQLLASAAEEAVTDEYRWRASVYARKLVNVEQSLLEERQLAMKRLQQLKAGQADTTVVFEAGRQLSALPKDVESARMAWTRAMNENLERAQPLGGMPPHARAFAGDPNGTPEERKEFEVSRRNFLALMFCLMVGTMGLPHLLTRFNTVPSVAAARSSVGWSLFFIVLLYLSIPALAVMVKFDVLSNWVGRPFDELPMWMSQWAKLDSNLLSVQDINGDGVLQLGELRLGADIVMLATPELGGMPYVVTALVTAGGLAAALSTADGLLLTIGNALARDIYAQSFNPQASPAQLVTLSKFVLLLVALAAAYVAVQRPAQILHLVSSSFSLAASAFVPSMVLGIFWRGANRAGAVAAMLVGLGVTMAYMALNAEWSREWLTWTGCTGLWWDIQPMSAGVFGVPAGLMAGVLVSRLWPQSHSALEVHPAV